MIDIQRECGKCLYDILFPIESPEFDSIEESYKEAITREPSLEGRVAEGDQTVTLEAYPQE